MTSIGIVWQPGDGGQIPWGEGAAAGEHLDTGAVMPIGARG